MSADMEMPAGEGLQRHVPLVSGSLYVAAAFGGIAEQIAALSAQAGEPVRIELRQFDRAPD